MHFFRFLILIALFLLPNAAHALEVKNIRFGGGTDKQRIVIETDRPVDYKSFTTRDPDRIVIDIPEFRWSVKNLQKSSSSFVTDVRHGTIGNGKARIVLDTNIPAIIESSFLLAADKTQPNRLVIDFKKADGSAPKNKTETSAAEPPMQLASREGTLGTLVIRNGKTVAPSEKKAKLPPAHGKAVTPLQPAIPQTEASLPAQPEYVPDIAENTPSNPVFKSGQKPLIIIDPGHGGQDPGAKAATGAYEKVIVLAVGLELKKALKKSGQYRVEMTRSTDVFIPLRDRVKFARKKGGDLFISLHADSMPNPDTSGASVYTLSNTASDKEAEKLAERENKSDAIAGVDLGNQDADVANILIDLVSRDTMNQSKYLANTVVGTLDNNGVHVLPRQPHRSAGFAVLKAMDIPSILVEMGYLTNLQEAQRLGSQDYRQRIAQALKSSVDSYFTKIAHRDVK